MAPRVAPGASPEASTLGVIRVIPHEMSYLYSSSTPLRHRIGDKNMRVIDGGGNSDACKGSDTLLVIAKWWQHGA